jgi:hypothetical protein
MHAVFAAKVGRNHGAVKRRQVQRVEKSDLQRGHVAIAEDGLG